MTIFLASWGFIGNFRDDFLPPEQQAKWVMRLLFPRWHWLVIGFLIITIIAILEGAYRTHARKVKELDTSHQAEITEKDKAQKSEMEQKEKEHELDRNALIEGHVKIQTSLINLRETEVEGLKKNFRLMREGQLKIEEENRERNAALIANLQGKLTEQANRIYELRRPKLTVERWGIFWGSAVTPIERLHGAKSYLTILLYFVNTHSDGNSIKEYELVVDIDGQNHAGRSVPTDRLLLAKTMQGFDELGELRDSILAQGQQKKVWARFVFDEEQGLFDRKFVLTVTDIYDTSYEIRGTTPSEYSDAITYDEPELPDEAFRNLL